MTKKINLPITDEDIKNLHAGDSVLLSGTIITGRDAAHKRLFDLLKAGEALPVDVKGEIIYYVGPAPAKPGHARVRRQATGWTNTRPPCSSSA